MPLDINQFRDRVDETKVVCEICKFRGHSLIGHLETKHNLTPGQYKKLYPMGLVASKVVSELIRRLDREPLTTEDLGLLIKGFEFKQGTENAELERVGASFDKTPEQAEWIPSVDSMFVFNDDIKVMAYGLSMGMNMFSEGPTGCGKTEGFLQLHARANRPCKQVNMHGDVTVANFVGQTKASPAKGTWFEYGDLPKAMGYPNGLAGPVTPGYSLIVDEIDYTPPQIAASLNPVLSRQRLLHIPETGETLEAQRGFNIMATANTGGKGDSQGVYTGTEVLNTAFLDRFPIKLKTDYLGWVGGLPKNPGVEERMLKERFPKAPSMEVAAMVKLANEIRVTFKQGGLPVTMSTRKLVEYFGVRQALGNKTLALEVTLLNWLGDDDKELVFQIMKRCGV